MTASISASYHMLSAPAAAAPAAMARTAARAASGSSRSGARLIPTSAVKTASAMTRGFVSAKNSKNRQPRSIEGPTIGSMLACPSINRLPIVFGVHRVAPASSRKYQPCASRAVRRRAHLLVLSCRSALLAVKTLERGCSAWVIPAKTVSRKRRLDLRRCREGCCNTSCPRSCEHGTNVPSTATLFKNNGGGRRELRHPGGRIFAQQRFATWLVWAVLHVLALPQLQNRLRVQTQWLWSYLSGQRSSRLIYEGPRRSSGKAR